MLARYLPIGFYQMNAGQDSGHPVMQIPHISDLNPGQEAGWADRPALVHLRHGQGHTLPAMLRRTPLRDALGKRIGAILRFHPVEGVDALPHGGMDEDSGLDKHVEHSQAEMEGRLDEAWQEWTTNQVPLGLLWITVDQAAMLRKTHGRDASEAMLAIVERTLLHALRPTEILGRWGSNEFLVLCHERTAEMLLLHARHVVGLARTADFRWWGDRVSLTVSVGAVQAGPVPKHGEKLGGLLERAQGAMRASESAGGNEVVLSGVVLQESEKNQSDSGGLACSQS
jgi:diguanylate cyclase (GGDEF)-like protein